MILFLVFIAVLSVVKAGKTNEVKNKNKIKNNYNNAIGMYFMDLAYNLKISKDYSETNSLLQEYYWALGCASQGRVEEVKQIIKDSSETSLADFFKIYKPQIMKMAKIAKEVDDKPIGYDLKNGESIGEYFDRKVSKRPAFMAEFEFFKNFDIQSFLKSIQ